MHSSYARISYSAMAGHIHKCLDINWKHLRNWHTSRALQKCSRELFYICIHRKWDDRGRLKSDHQAPISLLGGRGEVQGCRDKRSYGARSHVQEGSEDIQGFKAPGQPCPHTWQAQTYMFRHHFLFTTLRRYLWTRIVSSKATEAVGLAFADSVMLSKQGLSWNHIRMCRMY